MKLSLRTFRWAVLPERLRGMFNLNDPRWGRSDDAPTGADKPVPQRPEVEPSEPAPQSGNNRGQKRGPNQGPPDLDELWRDFNRKLGGLLGGVKTPGRGGAGGGGGGLAADAQRGDGGRQSRAAFAVLVFPAAGRALREKGRAAVSRARWLQLQNRLTTKLVSHGQ